MPSGVLEDPTTAMSPPKGTNEARIHVGNRSSSQHRLAHLLSNSRLFAVHSAYAHERVHHEGSTCTGSNRGTLKAFIPRQSHCKVSALQGVSGGLVTMLVPLYELNGYFYFYLNTSPRFMHSSSGRITQYALLLPTTLRYHKDSRTMGNQSANHHPGVTSMRVYMSMQGWSASLAHNSVNDGMVDCAPNQNRVGA
jgi:hypothetical protein